MRCPRCRGLMVREHLADWFRDGGYSSVPGWRCLCCGNIQDPVILKNRNGDSLGLMKLLATDAAGSCPMIYAEENRRRLSSV